MAYDTVVLNATHHHLWHKILEDTLEFTLERKPTFLLCVANCSPDQSLQHILDIILEKNLFGYVMLCNNSFTDFCIML